MERLPRFVFGDLTRKPARSVAHVFTWHNDDRGEILSLQVESNLSARIQLHERGGALSDGRADSRQ